MKKKLLRSAYYFLVALLTGSLPAFLFAALTPEPDNNLAAWTAVSIAVFFAATAFAEDENGKRPHWLLELGSPIVIQFIGVYLISMIGLALSGWSFVLSAIDGKLNRAGYLLAFVPAVAVAAFRLWRQRGEQPLSGTPEE